jgi:hypothetical protein
MCRVEVAKALRYIPGLTPGGPPGIYHRHEYPPGLLWGVGPAKQHCCGNTERAKPVGGESARVRLCREVFAI